MEWTTEMACIVRPPSGNRDHLRNLLHAFIHELDQDFDPPLSSRIRLDVYARRLSENAKVLVAAATEDEPPLGVCAFYCNDLSTRQGYITYLGVIPRARHLKLGQQLVQRSLETAWSQGMRTVALHTTPNDPRLQRFYERSGFTVVTEDPGSDHGRLLMRVAAPTSGTD